MPLSTDPSTEHFWTSSKSSSISTEEILTTDILTFAFANLGRYDNTKPIFLDAKNPSDFVSASQAYEIVCQLVTGLKRIGIKEGDCVCLHAYNNIWYPLIWLAIIGSKAIASPINPAYTSTELDRHLNLTNPKFIFTQPTCIESIIQAASKCSIPTSRIFFIGGLQDGPLHECRNWRTLLVEEGNNTLGPSSEHGRSLQDRVAVYAMTSGTTGLPKAAVIPHRYIVAQAAALEDPYKARNYQSSQLICLPVFHAFASPLALVLPLRLGVPTYFLPKFNLPDFLQAVHRFNITDSPVVPPIVGTLAHLSGVECEQLRSLRYVICAGATLNPGVQTRLRERLHPEANVAQCWGTTEAGWHTLFDWNEKDTSGSVGRLLPNVDIKLLDDHENSISSEDEVGEALIRSPGMFHRYVGDQQASSEAFHSDGFYRTGDFAFVRDDKVFYTGRRKEIMKVNGWQVSPIEVETVLLEDPRIVDAAVYGVSCDNGQGIWQTTLCAFVVRSLLESVNAKDQSSDEPHEEAVRKLTEEDVKQFVASRLISYKHLKRVSFVKRIPRSPTGKILRSRLNEVELDE
ncbi:hypothetical protein LTR47_005304 [Exophiala xenobiotica]|nr:hypothetical protein LTR41_003042 [Exophiala xenobiotica]KAK5222656.1 hypothetical protein LTR72_005493 [Exophiala xenobiotica]KAK5233681.1 hypothetical protein LTR47_005304 [Exophiala xenobiotica]KAK5245156.1 hypothetical protein LTS06_009354 [Exophiala xenobiotica]KAK5297529.1 hypothetical protein LTR14_003260 [Exophiala xenobiotica]